MYPCDKHLRSQIEANLRSFESKSQNNVDTTSAAVALTVISCSGEAALILTKRSAKLKDHAAQWALPGGRIDQGESQLEAALREQSEEVGLQMTESAYLGALDDYSTRSGYTITPLVFWSGADETTLVANPDEVASIHSIPFSELNRPDAPMFKTSPGSDQPLLAMPFNAQYIHAPTAAMLYQFREVAILGRTTRVAHYEQPTFAWK